MAGRVPRGLRREAPAPVCGAPPRPADGLQLKELIRTRAVALRLQAGSEEAGYLAQIFPLPRTPTVVIMKHGELKEYIAAGATRDDFFRRVQGAFDVATSPAPAAPAAAAPADASAPAIAPGAGPSAPGGGSPVAAPAAASAPAVASAPDNERSESVRRVLAERAAKLQAQKEEAERLAKEERSKAKAKAAAEASAGAETEAAATHRQAELLRRRRQQASEERRRILERIEDDKAERRERAARREQQRIDSLQTGDVAGALVRAPESKLPSTTRVGELTSLQVRLFDGSTMRSRFKTDAPFAEVRRWVDGKRTDGALPYTFRQLLTPAPNKAIDETDEARSLGELGLAPSSTLILIPVQRFASAYDGAGPPGLASQAAGLASQAAGLLLALLAWLLGLVGLGGNAEPAPAAAAGGGGGQGQAARRDGERRIRGFQSARDEQRDQQLYNGNSVSRRLAPRVREGG